MVSKGSSKRPEGACGGQCALCHAIGGTILLPGKW